MGHVCVFLPFTTCNRCADSSHFDFNKACNGKLMTMMIPVVVVMVVLLLLLLLLLF